MVSIGDIVKFKGPDADCTGEIVSSYVNDKGVTWYWMKSETGMMAQFTEPELIVVVKHSTIPRRVSTTRKRLPVM